MIIIGAILLILGLVLGISILTWIGAILLIIGLVLTIAGASGHPLGRKTYY